MKRNNSIFHFFSKVLPVLALCCCGSTGQLSAQDVTFQYEGAYHDYVIPQTNSQYIVLTAVGGDGGRVHFQNLLTDFKVSSGKGAFLQATFNIGDGANDLKPSSTLRFIVGEKGESELTAGSTGAGGGGGTGIAYKEVGTQNWVLLMVAGGGGASGHDVVHGKNDGSPGTAYVTGEEGDGKGGESFATVGGGAGAFGDDVYVSGRTVSGDYTYEYGNHAKKGWPNGPDQGEPTGGDCVSSGPQGGFGFGAGGDGDATGCYTGGGGGYTGGDSGDVDGEESAGGTSYLNEAFSDIFFSQDGSSTTSPEHGFASIEFTDSPSVYYNSIKFAYNTGKCIDDYGSNTGNGTNIQTYNCHSNANQKWFFNPSDRTIRSMLDNAKCLDLDHSNTANGTNIQLWDCNGTDAQKWVYNGIHKTIHSGVDYDKCFDAANGSANPSANVNIQLWNCQLANPNQNWEIDGATTVSDPYSVAGKHIIPVLAPGFAVHSHTGAESGSNIQLWTKDNTNQYEEWYLDGLSFRLINNNLCIDLKSSSTSNGNNIQLYTCNATDAQKWIYDGMTRTIRLAINPDKCMQIEKNTDGVYGKRSNVEIYDCNGSDAQLFTIQE